MMDQNMIMSDADFSKLRNIVHENTGISIGDSRRSMLVTRLRSRLREVQEPNFKAYISRLSSDPNEMQELTNRVTTNETYFYRTPRVWTYFGHVFLPEFFDRKQDRTMRVWSAAASSGEEAHTIGVFLEEARLSQPKFDYSVTGTDLSSRVLKTAEAGIYKGRSVSRFQKDQPGLFSKHMNGCETDGFRVNPQIKSRIKFKLHNLLHDLKNTAAFDAIFLRNVLIYFSNEDQETILRNMRDLIRPDGILFIGESETVRHLDTDFEQVEPIIYRPRLRTKRPTL